MRALCVSIHDVAPATWRDCCTLAAAVAEVDSAIPLTLLVVPDYHGRGDGVPPWYRTWLDGRLARGDEIALHGYTHRDDVPPAESWRERWRRTVYTAGEGEFASLSSDKATEKLAAGTAWCAAHGWPVQGFVAPAWLLSAGAWDALAGFDFTYTTTLGRFHLLRARRAVRALSLVYSARAPWRRQLSRHWNGMLAAVTRNAPLVRVGLHPADAEHPELVAHMQRVLDAARRGRAGMTKAEFAARAA